MAGAATAAESQSITIDTTCAFLTTHFIRSMGLLNDNFRNKSLKIDAKFLKKR